MEDAEASSFSIPGWIWFVAAVMAVSLIAVFVLKYQPDDDTRSEFDRGSRRRRRRSRHSRRRHRDRNGDPTDLGE